MGHLTESVTRERASARVEREATFHLRGAALARECYLAARVEGRRAGVSLDEIEALASMLAERIVRRDRRGRPRQVLAWIDRAERSPLLAAREVERIERDSTGREHLRQLARGLLRDSREWRDLAESHRARERRADVERGPAVVTTHDPLAPGWLALAERRESETTGRAEVAPIREDSRDLAGALAGALAETDATRRRVHAALLADLIGEPLASVAALHGWGVRAAKQRASEGRAILRELFPDPRDLAARVRAVAEREGFAPRVRLDAPLIGPEGSAARLAVERVRAEGRPLPQGAYSPATIRAARRNLRADLRTGRYGRPYPPARRADGDLRIAALAPDTRPERERAARERAQRERVAAEARRTYYRTHPLDWTESGAERAARGALAAL